MTGRAVLDRLEQLGAQLTVTPAGLLRYRGPLVPVSAAHHEELDQLKQALPPLKRVLLTLLQPSPVEAGAALLASAESPAEPLSSGYPCVSCGGGIRWNDAGVWRCVACWPTPLTLAARQRALG